MLWLYLTVGTLLGGFARYFISGKTYEWLGTTFPFGTFIVNLTGCFLTGIFDTLVNEKLALSVHARLFLMTAFCGAYTTFSALILESSKLIKAGQPGLGLLNLGASVLFGLILFRAGSVLGQNL